MIENASKREEPIPKRNSKRDSVSSLASQTLSEKPHSEAAAIPKTQSHGRVSSKNFNAIARPAPEPSQWEKREAMKGEAVEAEGRVTLFPSLEERYVLMSRTTLAVLRMEQDRWRRDFALESPAFLICALGDERLVQLLTTESISSAAAAGAPLTSSASFSTTPLPSSSSGSTVRCQLWSMEPALKRAWLSSIKSAWFRAIPIAQKDSALSWPLITASSSSGRFGAATATAAASSSPRVPRSSLVVSTPLLGPSAISPQTAPPASPSPSPSVDAPRPPSAASSPSVSRIASTPVPHASTPTLALAPAAAAPSPRPDGNAPPALAALTERIAELEAARATLAGQLQKVESEANGLRTEVLHSHSDAPLCARMRVCMCASCVALSVSYVFLGSLRLRPSLSTTPQLAAVKRGPARQGTVQDNKRLLLIMEESSQLSQALKAAREEKALLQSYYDSTDLQLQRKAHECSALQTELAQVKAALAEAKAQAQQAATTGSNTPAGSRLEVSDRKGHRTSGAFPKTGDLLHHHSSKTDLLSPLSESRRERREREASKEQREVKDEKREAAEADVATERKGHRTSGAFPKTGDVVQQGSPPASAEKKEAREQPSKEPSRESHAKEAVKDLRDSNKPDREGKADRDRDHNKAENREKKEKKDKKDKHELDKSHKRDKKDKKDKDKELTHAATVSALPRVTAATPLSTSARTRSVVVPKETKPTQRRSVSRLERETITKELQKEKEHIVTRPRSTSQYDRKSNVVQNR